MSTDSNQTAPHSAHDLTEVNMRLPPIGSIWKIKAFMSNEVLSWEIRSWYGGPEGVQAVCRAPSHKRGRKYEHALFPAELFSLGFDEETVYAFEESHKQYDCLDDNGACQLALSAIAVDENRTIWGIADQNDTTDDSVIKTALVDADSNWKEQNPAVAAPIWQVYPASFELDRAVRENGGDNVDWVLIGDVAWLSSPIAGAATAEVSTFKAIAGSRVMIK